jgi:endonuclease YncB( thermonuclease family)
LLLLLLCPLLVIAEVLTGKVVKITDGDTLVILDANHTQHKIRLAGIDAPEAKQAFGQRSKEHLSGLVAIEAGSTCQTNIQGQHQDQ